MFKSILIIFRKQLPEDDQHRSKHVGVLVDSVYKYNSNTRALVGFIVRISYLALS
jgi:hypothetical protein